MDCTSLIRRAGDLRPGDLWRIFPASPALTIATVTPHTPLMRAEGETRDMVRVTFAETDDPMTFYADHRLTRSAIRKEPS